MVKIKNSKFKIQNLLLLALCPMLLATSGCSRQPIADPREFPKGYFKDKVFAAVGKSEGVGPSQEEILAEKIVGLGRREKKKHDFEYNFDDDKSDTLTIKAWEALNHKDEKGVLLFTERCIELYSDIAGEQAGSSNRWN